MNRTYLRSLGCLAFAVCAASASAQAAYDPFCWADPMTGGFSNDYIAYTLPESAGSNNPLFGVTVGVSGTDNYGKQCVAPNGFTFESSGRVGFTIGSVGSIRSDLDDYLRLQFGMPFMAGGAIGFGMITTADSAGPAVSSRELYAGVDTAYIGASDRYAITQATVGDYRVQLRVDSIGDAAKLNWQIRNTTAELRFTGLWFGQWVTFLDRNGSQSPAGYIYAPGYLPITVAKRFRRNATVGGVEQEIPEVMNFAISQRDFYGLQIVNTPRVDNGVPVSDQTPVDAIHVGNAYGGFPLLSGTFATNAPTMPDANNLDALTTVNGYIQKWDPAPLTAGATREINAYYKSTWSNSNYVAPFSAVVDAPNLIQTNANDPTQLDDNPFTIRVWVDNTRGYSTVEREFPLDNVRIELNLPPGLTDASDPTRTSIVRTIPQVLPRNFGFVDFQVRASTDVNGKLPYLVKIDVASGAKKTISGTINVASTPKLRLPATANLVGSPWTYGNSNWDAILGLTVDQDFQAFTYDPQQQEYVIQTGPARGRGTWLITSAPQGIINLGGSPAEPADLTTGGLQIQLNPGWNLIANPYNYGFPLGTLLGVAAQDPSTTLTYRELVATGVISGALAFWDNDSPTPEYKYIGSDTDIMNPNRGYWIFVNSGNILTMKFPAVNEPFLGRNTQVPTVPTANSTRNWALQLVARNDKHVDGQNFVGMARSAKEASLGRAYEAPVAPIDGALSLGISQVIDGKEAVLSRALTEKSGKQTYDLKVYSRNAGPVTITWPNLGSLPKNVQFRIIDPATKTVKNLRRASGFTFESEARSTRTFTLEMEPGVAARPTIGTITASRSTRSSNSPVAISYTLSSEATVSVRILSGGREIYQAARGRAAVAGQNTVIWNLRDNANRVVAPGPYTVEITAESETGERVRKFYPINVTR